MIIIPIVLFLALVALSFGKRTQGLPREQSDKLSKYTAAQKYELTNEALVKSRIYKKVPAYELQELLSDKKFDELESLLAGLESDFHSDSAAEFKYIRAYGAFSSTSRITYETQIELLNDWVDKKQSYHSYAVRGYCLSMEGYRNRGSEYISKTPPENLAKARKLWQLGVEDLQKAIKLNPSHLPSYDQLVTIHRTSSGHKLANKALTQALKNIPQAFYIRQANISYLQPKWGASYAEAIRFVEESEIFAELNPRLWSLRGFIDANKAYDYMLEKDYSRAIEFYSKALSYSDKFYWLSSQAYVYYKLGDYEAAIENIQRIKLYLPLHKETDTLILNLELSKINDSKKLGWKAFNKDW